MARKMATTPPMAAPAMEPGDMAVEEPEDELSGVGVGVLVGMEEGGEDGGAELVSEIPDIEEPGVALEVVFEVSMGGVSCRLMGSMDVDGLTGGCSCFCGCRL